MSLVIIIFIVGIIIGFLISYAYFKSAEKSAINPFVKAQSAKKEENKEAIVRYIREHGKIANNDAERLLKVSDATATNYLEELEQEGIVEQMGQGRSVYYQLK
ncbi:winged helix-turn-helix domain-containing protein [Patescibacteria group bacterium]|nr:winged helix-turn-helix domain-containing protein [Patescibacteria group bacterium]